LHFEQVRIQEDGASKCLFFIRKIIHFPCLQIHRFVKIQMSSLFVAIGCYLGDAFSEDI
jgi:hypothetical protein